MILILVLLIVLFMLGTAPYYSYSRGWGYGPSGLLGVLLVILLIYLLLGNRL